MSPVFVIALLGVGAWALTKKQTPAAGTVNKAASEVPVDANSLLATALAPSLIDINALKQIYLSFMAAAGNQQKGGTPTAASRLAQYALTTFLKSVMLLKGVQPDPNELLRIAYAPTAGGAGLIGYGDIGVDVQSAAATALASNYTDVNGLGSYIGALAQSYNTSPPGPKRKRLLAFILALKAKQMALLNASKFPDANQFDSPVFFAVANTAAANVPTTTAPNSILAY